MPLRDRRRRSHHRTPLSPAIGEMPRERATDLADRRDEPFEGHANVGPDDRSAPDGDDIETARSARVPELDLSVIERDAHDLGRR
jgi:hypothetical protein